MLAREEVRVESQSLVNLDREGLDGERGGEVGHNSNE